ncbi:MAG TPA: hemolysin family protein [Candidatus Avimonas sp.]|jgi:putative hemolysin|nr:HlyC/CorC family transporter [Clostridiales bacterium]HOB37022.1 hemolysin family protein [Candidatus Avimonas sp.]HQA16477.1 hemolysin family protein [Candidatus Avimonas sp.]HQD38428.1 hemolysin family protein [Candidatus Avimonas sp.]
MDSGPEPDPAGDLILKLILLAFLIFVNAFFAASEIAVISLNDNKIQKMAEEGHKKARQVLKLTANSSNFLATIQIGVTLAGFLTSAVAAQSLAVPLTRWLTGLSAVLAQYSVVVHTVSVVLITVIMAFLNLVLGELVPKRIAMQKAEAISFASIGVLNVIAAVMRPFVKLLSVSTNVMVRLFGLDPNAAVDNVTEEEIRMMVDVGGEKGVIEDTQKEMINNIFEFDDITAEEIMTPRTEVEVIEVNEDFMEALRICVDNGYSRLPVYEEDIDNIVGILYVKDLLPYVGREIPENVTIRHLMRETYFIPGTKKCRDLFAEMTEKRVQMSIVVDEYGGFAGIVTMEDLLESIVGNIQDEYDNEEEEVTKLGDNTFDVDGSIDIEELGEILNIRFPDGEYETLGGYIMDVLGRIPGEDEHPQIKYKKATFTVLEMDERRIGRVHIEVEPETGETQEEKED